MAYYKPIFKSKKRKYYIKEYSPLWWIINTLKGLGVVSVFYLLYLVLWAYCG